MSRDDGSWNDGDKLSFSERDRRRRERQSDDRRPRGVSQAKLESATRQYVKQLDGLFSSDKGGAEAEKLAAAVRAAHGSAGLADACRAYRDAVGHPDDPKLLSLFLDSADSELVVSALEAIGNAVDAGGFEPTSGLRSQIRMLRDDRDSAIAELAEDLSEQL